jgi:excisionase family DNA binding protein
MDTTSNQQLMTLDDLCSRWKVPRAWVYRQTHRGCSNPLPVVRLGRLLRFREHEVEAWLADNQRGDRD